MAKKLITIPPNYAGSSQLTDLANLGHDNIAYSDTTLHKAPKNASYSIRNGDNITTDSRAGSDTSLSGNPYANSRNNGMFSGRVGKYSSTYIVACTYTFNMLSSTSIGTSSDGCWPSNVNGLCWSYSSSGSHSANRSSYPQRCILLYANASGRTYRIEANQKVFGLTLGTAGSDQSTNYWTCYQIKASDANYVKNNDLYWGGFAFQMYANQGSGSQTLTSYIWNVRPTLYKDTNWDISTSWNSSVARQVMYNKNSTLYQAASPTNHKRLETY